MATIRQTMGHFDGTAAFSQNAGWPVGTMNGLLANNDSFVPDQGTA
jgi:hypothetical protein